MRELNYKLFALCTTAIISAGTARAETCMPSDCVALGFTQTKDDCAGYNALLCPYDLSKYFCSSDVCDSMYQYSCNGTNETGGVGYACNNKYSKCQCISGYVWNDNACTKCDSSYNLTCNETGWTGDRGSECGGYYKQCICASGYCADGNGNCTQEACKMDYKLKVNFNMPWGSCEGGFNTTDWQIDATIYDKAGKTLISSASIRLNGSEIVNGGSAIDTFNNKIPEGEYKVYLSSSFSQGGACSQFSVTSIYIGGNKFDYVSSSGVVAGLYKRNSMEILVNGSFGAR